METTQIYTHLAIGQIQRAHQRFHPASRQCPPSDAGVRKQIRMELRQLSRKQLDHVLELVLGLGNADAPAGIATDRPTA